METVYADFAPKGVKFYYIYKALAHPEKDGYVQPITLEERLMHVAEAKKKLGTKITWLADSMSNDIKHAMGDSANSEFIIGPDGKIVSSRSWSNPSDLRADLTKLVGTVSNPTRVSDLKMVTEAPSKAAASGVVPRLARSGRMQALKTVAKIGSQPFYVKLRAEADDGLLGNGAGKLYVSFHLDPIYRVHWNNLAAPVEFEVKSSDGVTVSPAKGQAPKIAEPSDIDPREFLLDVKGSDGLKGPLELTVRYFACNDDEGWCKPVTQQYVIYLETDPDAGRTMGGGRGSSGRGGLAGRGGGGGGFGSGGAGSRRGGGGFDREAIFQRIDSNKDGKISKDEVTGRAEQMLRGADKDGDGVVTKKEFLSRGTRSPGR